MRFWKKCKCSPWMAGAALGLLFLGIGTWQGQFSVIFRKAVMICLECIGIG